MLTYADVCRQRAHVVAKKRRQKWKLQVGSLIY